MYKNYINCEPTTIAYRQNIAAISEIAKCIEQKSLTSKILVATFKGRIKEFGNKNTRDAEKQMYSDGVNGCVAGDLKGRTFQMDSLSKAYAKTIQQLGFTYLSDNERRAGNKLWNIPFKGGNYESGTYNHIHSLIAVPFEADIANFKERITNIFANQIHYQYKKIQRSRIATDVHFESEYKINDGAYVKYCARLEDNKYGSGTNKIILDAAFF